MNCHFPLGRTLVASVGARGDTGRRTKSESRGRWSNSDGSRCLREHKGYRSEQGRTAMRADMLRQLFRVRFQVHVLPPGDAAPMHRRLEAVRPSVPCPIASAPGKAMSNMSGWPRKLIIAIGVSWWTGLFGLAFLAYFVTRPCADGICDGLGRHLMLAPSFVRILLHSDRLWAGWRWAALEMVVLWMSAGIGYMALEWTQDSTPAASDLQPSPELLPPTLTKAAAKHILNADLKEMQGTIAEAAARATSRSDITLEPEEEGWSIRVNGEVALQVDSSATGQKALAYARALIDGRKSVLPIRPFDHD